MTGTSGRTAVGVAAGAAAGAMWGLVFLMPALIADHSPWQLAGARYAAYGAFSLLLIAPRWRSLIARVDGRTWRALFGLSLLGNTAYYVLLAAAVQWGGIAMTSLVIGFLPVLVTVIGSRQHGAVPLRRLAPSLGLGAAGLLCVAAGTLAQGPTDAPLALRLLGLLCAVGALLSWSAYAVVNSRWLGRVPTLSSNDWNLLTGVVTGVQGVLMLVPALWLDDTARVPAEWARFAVVTIGVAFLASVVGNSLWNVASRRLPLTLVGQMILFETLFALTYGFAWAQRGPTPIEGAAIALLVAGVLGSASVHRRPASPAPAGQRPASADARDSSA